MIRIKRNYFWYAVNALFIFLMVFNQAAAQPLTGSGAADLGVSNYRHFLIYPHFEKALKAQQNNDEVIALREFEHIHKLAPESIPIVMYLVEAYRHFGHDDRAQALLTEQAKLHPDDVRIQAQIAALTEIKPITNLVELQQLQKSCDAQPNALCRGTITQSAINLGYLDIALEQLSDLDFRKQPQAQTLLQEVLQRAIYLEKWVLVDKIYTYRSKHSALSEAEHTQWFNALIQGHLDKRFLSLQSQGLFSSAGEHISYASTLQTRGEHTQLERYLASHQPSFKTPAQEKSWLYLLSDQQADKYHSLSNYLVQFPENIDFIAQQILPIAIQSKDYAVAKKMLNAVDTNSYLSERYNVSVALNDSQETVRVARAIFNENPADLDPLDQLSWQLMRSGRKHEAAQILMNNYPFSGNVSTVKVLMARLSDLLSKSPKWVSANQKQSLLRPLQTADLRQFQSTLSWFANDCQAIQALLGDLSPNYNAHAWKLLAGCYQDTLPGLALYAYQQAQNKDPNPYNQRAVAYQAYQVEDYKVSLRTWKALGIKAMSDKDLIAATNTAQAAGDPALRDIWLLEQKKRGLDNTNNYWWLHAQRYLPDQPELALVDLNRAVLIQPSAQVYAARADIYRQQGKLADAIKDLRKSILLEPENKLFQAALGFALWDNGEVELAKVAHENALQAMPDDDVLIKQLTYEHQRLGNTAQTQQYARLVIDDLSDLSQVEPLSLEQNQDLFDFRRLHEDTGRRWTFNADTSLGLNDGSVGSVSPVIGSAPSKSYRSFAQMELDYRLGQNMIVDGDLLSVYSRVFADTGMTEKMPPVKNPMLGLGVRWKPLRDTILFVALEQQQPLSQNGTSDTMARISASFLNHGRFSDEWHPNGKGWLAQNLYLDAAHYFRSNTQSWTADYRLSWHHKLAEGQTLEPYTHIQTNGYRTNGKTQGSQFLGIGARWNLWTGGSRYNAWPHKFSVGVEYQRVLNTINQGSGAQRNNVFLTFGLHW